MSRLRTFRSLWSSCVLAVAAALPAVPAMAQQWHELGPAPITNGAYTGRVSAIACSPTDANRYFVAGADGGVWRTDDGGTTWTPLTDFMPTTAIGALAIDPVDENIVYAGTGEGNHANHSRYGLGLYKSLDGGATWSRHADEIFAGRCFTKLVINPQDPRVLYASITRAGGFPEMAAAKGHPQRFGPLGVFRSADGGLTWTHLAGGLPNQAATDLAIDPVNPSTVYAAVGYIFGSPSNGIYKTTNGGDTWTKLTVGLPTSTVGRISIALALTDPSRLYALITRPADAAGGGASTLGAFRSLDAGATWSSIGGGTSQATYGWYLSAVSVSPTESNTVFFAGFDLTRWTNGSSATVTPPHVDLHALAWDAAGRLVAGDDGGVHRSANLGGSWQSLNVGLGLIQFYAGLSTHPTNELVVFGGTQDNGSNRRNAAGLAWVRVTGGDGGWTQLDQLDPSRVFTEAQGTGSLYRSTNGGQNFSFSGNGIFGRNCFLPPYVIDPTDSNRILYGTERVFRSLNGGGSWTPLSPDLSDGAGAIRALAIAPSDPSVVYAATNDGNVQVSTDGGATFTLIADNIPGWPRVTREIFVHPTDAARMYLAVAYFGTSQVRRTPDMGATWETLDGDLPDIPVNVLAVDPRTQPDTLYAGTDAGLYRSADDGATWRRYGVGLPHGAVIDIRLETARDRLVVGTQGRGAWSVSIAPCPADFDGNGTVEVQDFLAFLNAYASGEARADVNADGDVNVQDFLAFLSLYAAACP